MQSRLASVITMALCATLAALPARGQGIGSRIKQRIQDKVNEKVDQVTDSATDAAIARGEKVIKCASTDKSCIKKANDAGREVLVTDQKGQALPDQKQAATQAGVLKTVTDTASATTAAAPAAPPGQGVWLNYDFVPGDRVIFTEDFSGNDVGDFPRRLRLVNGNLEVVKIKGQPMLHSVDGGLFYIKLPEKLPRRFTVELNLHTVAVGNPIQMWTTDGERSARFGCYSNQAWIEGNGTGANSGAAFQSDPMPGFVNCTFTIDNAKGIRAYVNEHRTGNAPQDSVVLTDTLFVQIPSGERDDPILLTSIRIAAGGKKLYDVLSESGRVATQGIFFDTGSDHIRPESTPTLEEIAAMLRDHGDLRLTIEGHTDNVGNAAANQTLSEQRAAAVKQYLVTRAKVDPVRLTTKGFGASKPVAPNTTAEGRQNNRRVELVKM